MGVKFSVNYKRQDDNSNLLIENCKEEIRLIVRNLRLTTLLEPEAFLNQTQGNKHRYYSECVDESGENLFLHVLIINTDSARAQMIREIHFGKFLLSHKQQLHSTIFPEYVNFSPISDTVLWLISKKLSYSSLEKNGEIEKCNKVSESTIRAIVESINYIGNLSNLVDMQSLDLRKFTNDQMIDQIDSKLEELMGKKLINQNLAQEVRRYCHNGQAMLTGRYCFSHGDFHPGNILLPNDSIGRTDIKIIDWEDYQIRNIGYDLSLLFVRLWREPKIRKRILVDFMSKVDDSKIGAYQDIFRFNILYFAVLQGFTTNFLEFELDEIDARKAWFRRLLESALVSYEELIQYHENN